MTADEQFDQGAAPAQPASQAGAAILDRCRAARIDDVTEFAACLVETGVVCTHRLAFNTFRYCVHPLREAIIARTLAAEPPPAS
jgi:hypothetical protein